MLMHLFFTRLFVSEQKQIALMADEKLHSQLSHRLFATSCSEMRDNMDLLFDFNLDKQLEYAVVVRNMYKKFKKKVIYENVNLQIRPGECIGLVGENGSGKSVLFQIMTGLIRPDRGQIIVNGDELGKHGRDFPRRVGILINEPGYIETCSGYKNLLLLAEIQNIINEKTVQKTMEMVGLDYRDKTIVRKYSMGMRQKLGIAQAIMEGQTIVMLDEPYNALDYKTNKEITQILQRLKDEGKTLLLTSHQHVYLERLCDRIYCIDEHNVVDFDDRMREKYFDM